MAAPELDYNRGVHKYVLLFWNQVPELRCVLEFHPHDKDGVLGPSSMTVVYMDPRNYNSQSLYTLFTYGTSNIAKEVFAYHKS